MVRSLIKQSYVPAVMAGGIAALLAVALGNGLEPTDGQLIACVTLIVGVCLGEIFPVRVGGDAGEVAFSSTFTFALLLGWGPGPALVGQLGACVIAAIIHRARLIQLGFNLAQYVLAIAAATLVLDLLHGGGALRGFTARELLEVSIAAAAFFVVNTGLVAGVVALHADMRLRDQLRAELRMQTGTEGILLGMAPLALLGVQSSPVLLILVGLPLLAVQRAGRQALDNERLALRDALTGLANRICLNDRFAQALARARREDVQVAVLIIDLDRFKDINDTLGHHAGDQVLRRVAESIDDVLRDGDTVARLGGDEFAVLLPEVSSHEEAYSIAQRVLAAIAQPMRISDVTLEPSGSIGIACRPAHGEDVETLIRHADAAMYTAKEQHAGIALHALGSDGQKLTQLKLAGRLGRAIATGEIELLYQPQIRPRTGEVVSAEALARWRHPHFGLLSPSEFIPLAERSGQIHALTIRVIDDAVDQIARWAHEGLDLTVAVNLSASSMADAQLPAIVEAACSRAGVHPGRLVLELTEGMLLAHPERAIGIAERLAALGTEISVDDFGTGFSSLEQLVRLPAAELKIDRSFVMNMVEDPRSAAIVRCVADLAHSMGLRFVAEGVETDAARRALEALGCDVAQGYLWSGPVSAEALADYAAGARVVQAA